MMIIIMEFNSKVPNRAYEIGVRHYMAVVPFAGVT